MACRDGPSGIGGWLAFYLVTLGVISPLVTIVNLYSNLFADPAVGTFYGDRWPALLAAELAINFLLLAAIYYVVWRFFLRKEWRTVRIAIAVMWISAVPVALLELVVVSLLGGLDFGALVPASIGDLLKPMIYSALWTTYLLRSVRVANTYPREDEAAEGLAEVFE